MKRCSQCGVQKTLDDFYGEKRSADGRTSACKCCILAGQRRAYDANPEHYRAQKRKDYAAHREKRIAYVRQYEKLNREKVTQMYATRRHGAENVLADLVAEQGAACYLCGRPIFMPVPGRGPTHTTAVVDHDHACPVGHPKEHTCELCRRGAACSRCNMLISFGDEDPDLLRRIAVNLERQLPVTRERMADYVTPVCLCENCGDEITYPGKGRWPKKFCSRKCMERKRTLTRAAGQVR